MGSGRRNLDWIVGWWSESLVTELNDAVSISLISIADLENYEDDLIIERVVGQYWVDNLGQTFPLMVHTRLFTTETDGSGNSPGYNISLLSDAEQQFMWHKVHYLDAGINFGSQNMGDGNTHPEWSHLDVRVNRKIGDLEELRFQWQVMFPDTHSGFTWAAWIRVLVKH